MLKQCLIPGALHLSGCPPGVTAQCRLCSLHNLYSIITFLRLFCSLHFNDQTSGSAVSNLLLAALPDKREGSGGCEQMWFVLDGNLPGEKDESVYVRDEQDGKG